jgi:hypothetical protein
MCPLSQKHSRVQFCLELSPLAQRTYEYNSARLSRRHSRCSRHTGKLRGDNCRRYGDHTGGGECHSSLQSTIRICLIYDNNGRIVRKILTEYQEKVNITIDSTYILLQFGIYTYIQCRYKHH